MSSTGGFLTRRNVVESGLGTDSELAAAVCSGDLTRAWRGVYHAASDDPDGDDDDPITAAYRRRVIGGAMSGGSERVVSHQSAAALHGLPLLGREESVHFTVDRKAGGQRRTAVIHATPLTGQDVVEIRGLPVTSLARTAVDVARSGTFTQAVCAMDGALALGVTVSELTETVRRGSGRSGIDTARRALLIADGDSESVGESFSRVLMHGFADVPSPRLQHEFRTESGLFVARSDFDWEGRLVGEFDGRGKYERDLRPGESIADAVWREKRREDRLRDLGVIVVRWTWFELTHPRALHALLSHGLRRAGLL